MKDCNDITPAGTMLLPVKQDKKRIWVKVGHVKVPIYQKLSRGKLRYEVPYYPNGPGTKRRLRGFNDLEKAQAFAKATATGDANDHQVFARVSPAHLQAMSVVLTVLMPLLEKLGLGLRQALEEYLAAKTAAGQRNLAALVKDYLEQPWVTKSRTRWKEALVAFLAAKRSKGCRESTLHTLKYTLMPVRLNLGNLAVGDVDASQLHQMIYRPSCSSRAHKTFYCSYHNFYDWLKRNGYLRVDRPCAMDAHESPKVDHSRPAIMDVTTMRKAFQLLAEHGQPNDVLVFALGLLSGCRVCEIHKLVFSDLIPGEQINMPASKAKTRVDRSIPLLPALDAWIKPFYGREGLLTDLDDMQTRIARVLKRHGITWKRNWMRHSYCSYRLGATGDLVETSRESGNSPDVLARNYLQLVTASQAAEYFGLTPKACGIKDWDAQVKARLSDQPECIEHRKNSNRPAANKPVEQSNNTSITE